MVKNNMEEEIPLNELRWDKPDYAFNGHSFIPLVAESSTQEIPPDFNARVIELEGGMQANLEWKGVKEQAHHYMEQGYFLFWKIKLGLFSELRMPLAYQAQYLSLGLSLEHFRDVIWKEFKSKSLGVAVYQGSADFSHQFPWDEQQIINLRGWIQDHFLTVEQFTQETSISTPSFDQINPLSLSLSPIGQQIIRLFCRDVAVEYLTLLTSRLPDSLPCYVLLDLSSIPNLLWQTQLIHPERFEKLNLAIKGAMIPFEGWGWNGASPYGIISQAKQPILAKPNVTIGVCLPAMDMCRPSQYQGLEEALSQLTARQIPFRLIPESRLTTDWDGLDYLLYIPAGLSVQGKRKLQGFCAAGGTAVVLGKAIGLSYEISLFDLMENY